MNILVNINNQTLSLASNPQLASDSKNYLKIKANFQSSDWKGQLAYGLFTYNNETYKKYFGVDDGLAANEMYVPKEVIHAPGFNVSFFCGDLITTNLLFIPISESGYTENIKNQSATPTVMEQMNTLMSKYASICNEILQDCEAIKEEIMEVNNNG